MSRYISISNRDGLTLSQLEGSTGTSTHTVMYDPSMQKVTYHTSKTFVVDHPTDNDKFLVHACLEGPEAGVYYRGKTAIVNDEYVTIVLPDYVDKLAKNFTVHITEIYDESKKDQQNILKTSEVFDNRFNVYGKNGKFFWIVYGERLAIDVEPSKSSVSVRGSGPYTWVV
jgi:hypothetical protein